MPSRQEQKASALIDALVRDLEPVRSVRFASLFLGCLAFEGIALVSIQLVFGLRADLWARLADPVFLTAVTALGGGAAWCASIAIRLSLPGRVVDQRAPWLLCGPALFALAVLLLRPAFERFDGLYGFASECTGCIGLTVAGAALPWFAALLLLRRLAPLNPLRVGLFVGLSAFLAGALATELHCPNSTGPHLALAHYLPVTLLAAASGLACSAFLRTRTGAVEQREPGNLSA